MIEYRKILSIISLILFCACYTEQKQSLEVIPFGITSKGDSVALYRLTNSKGAVFEAIDYGARVISINVPDKNGILDNVIVGYGDIESFENGDERFFGALLGRYANRIADGSFIIDSVKYQLDCNNTPNGYPCHLHG